MSMIMLHLTDLWKRIRERLSISFEVPGPTIDDAELDRELGYGRE